MKWLATIIIAAGLLTSCADDELASGTAVVATETPSVSLSPRLLLDKANIGHGTSIVLVVHDARKPFKKEAFSISDSVVPLYQDLFVSGLDDMGFDATTDTEATFEIAPVYVTVNILRLENSVQKIDAKLDIVAHSRFSVKVINHGASMSRTYTSTRTAESAGSIAAADVEKVLNRAIGQSIERMMKDRKLLQFSTIPKPAAQ